MHKLQIERFPASSGVMGFYSRGHYEREVFLQELQRKHGVQAPAGARVVRKFAIADNQKVTPVTVWVWHRFVAKGTPEAVASPR